MKIALQPWKEKDIPSLVQLANNFNVWITLRDSFPHPYTRKDAEGWIAFNRPDSLTNFSITVDGSLAGGAGIVLKNDIYRKNAEIGYWIGEPFWGKGIATEAVRQLLVYTFSTFDIIRVYAEVFANNPASMKVLEKNGFEEEAIRRKAIIKNNQLLDAHVWVKFRTDD